MIDWVLDADKPIAVTAHAERGKVEVVDGVNKDALSCDINTFSRLFAGSLTAAQARELGLLKGGNPSVGTASDALLYGHIPYRSWVEAG